MPEVKTVIAYLGPNDIVEGFYTLEDGLLTMVEIDGSPLDIAIDVTARPGDKVEETAKILTKKIRQHFRNRNFAVVEEVPGFDKPLQYGGLGQA